MATSNAKIKIKDNLTPLVKKQQKLIKGLVKEAYKEFVENTPIKTGNARRNTQLKQDTILANYGYAQKLDEGSSKQSPDGMTQPTNEFLEKRFTEIMERGE